MRVTTSHSESVETLFDLPCACQSLRRLTRITTRIYDRELRRAGIEITQFGLLTALNKLGYANQKRLSIGFAMDSTTLTRTLCPLIKRGLVQVRPGKDKRERLFSLTQVGKQQIATAQPYWENAEQALRQKLGDTGWKQMREVILRVTRVTTVF